MRRSKGSLWGLFVLIAACGGVIWIKTSKSSEKTQEPLGYKLIAFASYGEQGPYKDVILGAQQALESHGFREGKNVQYMFAQTGNDISLVPNMLSSLCDARPDVVLLLSTPVVQYSWHYLRKRIPFVYGMVADPQKSGVGPLNLGPLRRFGVPGVVDRVNFPRMISLTKDFFPHLRGIGVVYDPASLQDQIFMEGVRKASAPYKIRIYGIRAVPAKEGLEELDHRRSAVEVLYGAPSDRAQLSLKKFSPIAKSMGTPILNSSPYAVRRGQALLSYGVDYIRLGKALGELMVQVMETKEMNGSVGYFDQAQILINGSEAKDFGILIPEKYKGYTYYPKDRDP